MTLVSETFQKINKNPFHIYFLYMQIVFDFASIKFVLKIIRNFQNKIFLNLFLILLNKKFQKKQIKIHISVSKLQKIAQNLKNIQRKLYNSAFNFKKS